MTKKSRKNHEKNHEKTLNTFFSPVEAIFDHFFGHFFSWKFSEKKHGWGQGKKLFFLQKVLLIGRKIFVFQAPHLVWSGEISMKSALWSPFSAHLYDTPPSHNFFQTGFRLKILPFEKILDSYIPKSAHFSQKKKIDPVS